MEAIINDPELSRDGKRNSFTHHCHVVDHYRHFAVCAHLCDERKAGRLDTIYTECSVAIGKKRCPALAMLEEERESNRAIYFKERVVFCVVNGMEKFKGLAESAASFLGTVSKHAPSKSVPISKSSVIESIDTGDYATAISAAAAPAPKVVVEVKAGESLMDLARRMMSQQK